MLLSLKWFQIAALKKEKSTQQGIFNKHNFYKQIKKMNQVDRELKQIKKRCVKQLKNDVILFQKKQWFKI